MGILNIPETWIKKYGKGNGKEVREIVGYMLDEIGGTKDISVKKIKTYGRENGPEVKEILEYMIREYAETF